MDIRMSTLAERADLIGRVWDMPDQWDEFMNHDPIGASLFGSVAKSFRHLAVAATDSSDQIVAHGTAMAFRLDADGRRKLPDRGWDQALVLAHQDLVHARLGRVVERVAAASQTVSGSLDEWESWTGVDFSTNGPVPVPGGLVPVQCIGDLGVAVYVEPNMWVRHDLT